MKIVSIFTKRLHSVSVRSLANDRRAFHVDTIMGKGFSNALLKEDMIGMFVLERPTNVSQNWKAQKQRPASQTFTKIIFQIYNFPCLK